MASAAVRSKEMVLSLLIRCLLLLPLFCGWGVCVCLILVLLYIIE